MRVVGIKSVSVADRPPPDTVSEEGRQRPRPPIYRRLARQSICKLSDVAVFAPHCETERRGQLQCGAGKRYQSGSSPSVWAVVWLEGHLFLLGHCKVFWLPEEGDAMSSNVDFNKACSSLLSDGRAKLCD